MLSIAIISLLVIHVVVSLLIILVVLMQRPKNEGLGAAFGGGMTDNLFGAQTTNVLQKFTRVLGGLFFGLTLILSVLYAKQASNVSKTDIQLQLSKVPVPVVPPTPLVPTNAAPAASPFAPDSAPLPLASATPAAGMTLGGAAAAASPSAAPVASPSAAPEASVTAQPGVAAPTNASAQPSPTASTKTDDKKQ